MDAETLTLAMKVCALVHRPFAAQRTSKVQCRPVLTCSRCVRHPWPCLRCLRARRLFATQAGQHHRHTACRGAPSAQQHSGEAEPSPDSTATASSAVSRREVGAGLLAIGPALTAASVLQPPAASAAALTLKDVTPTIAPAGPLSARCSSVLQAGLL